MSSPELSLVRTKPQRRILWLVLAHVVVGLMIAFVEYSAGRSPTLRRGFFLGLVFSQTSLLGIWGGLGSSRCWGRLIGAVVGAVYLGSLLAFGLHERIVISVSLATICTAVPLLIVGFFRLALRLDSSPLTSMRRIQFSIRHLMILTFVVACVLMIGKWVQPLLPPGKELLWMLLFGVPFAVVGVLPVWFVFAMRQPMRYGVGLVVVGAWAGYSLAGFGHVGVWTAAATEALAVVVSLLAVRSCGYRLDWLPAGRQGER